MLETKYCICGYEMNERMAFGFANGFSGPYHVCEVCEKKNQIGRMVRTQARPENIERQQVLLANLERDTPYKKATPARK